MIIGNLDQISLYKGIDSKVYQGLTFLTERSLSSLPDGRISIEGDDLYAVLSSYETLPKNNRPEAHRSYIDIQYLISGRELVGVAFTKELEGVTEAYPDKDLWFYRGATEALTLTGNRFMIFWPEDAHAPCISVSGIPEKVRKCVIKVRV